MTRAIDVSEGRIYVVTDLHGDWQAYSRYRDHFLTLLDRGEADTLVVAGDLIHGYGPAEEDYSVSILWDLMQLQAELGSDRLIMLLGNHELPHIYSVTLSKGDITFTPRFEHAMGDYRPSIVAFLKTLPFLVRTAAGVMVTHAGASPKTAVPAAAERLLNFSHDTLLNEVDEMLQRNEVIDLIESTLGWTVDRYESQALEYLAVTGPEDPRYLDLLRGFVVSSLEPEWSLLWEFFFTQCEKVINPYSYDKVLERFLESYSSPVLPQKLVVTGHIAVKGGYEIIADRQLRLASWQHAQPREAGSYLLFDASRPLESPRDLLQFIYPMP
jgi:Icc-related predicted phosphoesterase